MVKALNINVSACKEVTMAGYVHGYAARESLRLDDQARTLYQLLYSDLCYPTGSRVLEAGCGTGAQTLFLAGCHPEVDFVSIDIEAGSLGRARAATRRAGLANVAFQQADILHLPFAPASFDHVFVCFVLEHLADPQAALGSLKGVLRPGGSITVIEGDHGSFYCHPESEAARRCVRCLVEIQASLGGDALIGRRLYPLLVEAQYGDVTVTPKMVYVDDSRPQWVAGFSRNTFIAMVRGVETKALAMGLIDEVTWQRGMADLMRATQADGTFCYTFFAAKAHRC
jgi:SAM-dependent methyltransferase